MYTCKNVEAAENVHFSPYLHICSWMGTNSNFLTFFFSKRGNVLRNMIGGSFPSHFTKVFPLFFALYFISTVFFLGYLPFLFVCPSLPVGIFIVPYKDLIWWKLFEAEQHGVGLIRQLNLARGVPLLQVLRDTIHWLYIHMGI